MIIDLSSNNGVVDFNKIKAAGVTDVILRATMGVGTTDRLLAANAGKASEAGLKVSYYHFSYPDQKNGGTVVADATAEANYFTDTISKLPAYVDLIVDCEPKDSQGNDTPLTPAEYALWLQTWLDTVKAKTNTIAVVYTYADYLNTHLPKGHKLGKYKLWIANYSPKITNPPIPVGWTKWYMWQYSQSGKMAGVMTAVDLSKLNS